MHSVVLYFSLYEFIKNQVGARNDTYLFTSVAFSAEVAILSRGMYGRFVHSNVHG